MHKYATRIMTVVWATSLSVLWVPVAAATTATGGVTNDAPPYRIHTFTNSDTFTVSSPGSVEVLVVAGGGGGGRLGGGGGAGGLVYSNAFAVGSGGYTVTIGAGGAGSTNRSAKGGNGGNSAFGSITATGGGGGGSYNDGYRSGSDGGSGGGAAGKNSQAGTSGTPGNATPPGQGSNGGTAPVNGLGGGGGGGSGAAGGNAGGAVGAAGGTGLVYTISGTAKNYAGGGGGGGDTAGAAGAGGGGAGATGTNNGTPGTANTGGGGGGSRDNNGGNGGNGGSGIVIVRYRLDAPAIVNGTGLNRSSTSAELWGSLISTGMAPTTVYAFWSTNDCATDESVWLANGIGTNLGLFAEGATVRMTATPLLPNTIYYFNFMASNSAGRAWGAVSSSPSFRTFASSFTGNGTLYWDADGNPSNNVTDGTGLGAAGTGTTGIWNAAGMWWDGGSVTNQKWVDNSTAVFAGPAGRIQLGANVTAAALQFRTPGHMIDLCTNASGTTAYNLTANGVSGASASVFNSSGSSGSMLFTLNIASGTQTSGVSVTGGRLAFTKDGAGTLNVTNTISLGATYAPFNVQGGGRLNLIGNTGSGDGPGYVGVTGGSTLDVGDNGFAARAWTLSADSTITTSGSGSLQRTSSFNNDGLLGTLSGSLLLIYAANGQAAHTISGANSYTGGTWFSTPPAGTCELVVLNDCGLGVGRVRMENSTAGNTSLITFRSSAPTVGSLESANAGVKQVLLGNAGVTLASAAMKATWVSSTNALTLTAGSTTNLGVGQAISSASGIPANAIVSAIVDGTHFTISQNTTNAKTAVAIAAAPINTTLTVGSLSQSADVFGGAISQVAGTTGAVTKIGSGTWTLTGTNSYTGPTTVSNGTLVVNGVLTNANVVVAGGTLAGSGTLTFNLGATPDLIRVDAGTGNVASLRLNFTGAPTLKSYTLVQYAPGATLLTTNNPATGNTFSNAFNVPAGYKWTYDTAARKVVLAVPPAATALFFR